MLQTRDPTDTGQIQRPERQTGQRDRKRDPEGDRSSDAEALVREARRRQRRRRAAYGVTALVLALVVGLLVGTDGSGPSTPGGTSGSGSSGAATAGNGRSTRAGSNLALPDASASQIDVLGGGPTGLDVAWMVNATGAYETTDAGRHWRDITPPSLAGHLADGILGPIAAVSARDLWLPVQSAAGVGFGVERTTDGGRHWQFAPLDGCVATEGCVASLSFVNADDGFALAGPDSQLHYHLLRTTDGGATWQTVSEPQYIFSDVSLIRFTTTRDGWGVTGLEDMAPTAAAAGVLWHTTDGGRTWTRARGLPRGLDYLSPTFFSPRTGVVLAYNDRVQSGHQTTVFATTDGGRTWTAHPLPHDGNMGAYTGFPLPFQYIPFSATSLRHWSLLAGPTLYMTGDGGRHWRHVHTTPRWSTGAVTVLHFGSPRDGWALAPDPACQVRTANQDCPSGLGGGNLMVTANGGRTWYPLPFSSSKK